MCAIDLTFKERRCLELQLKDAPSIRVYRRTLALLEIADGRSVSQIAGMLRVSREAVYDWVAHYIEHRHPASLVDRPISGRPSQWSDEATVILREALEQSPDTLGYMAVNWTMQLLREHIEKQWGQRPSDRALRRQLGQLGYVWKRPRHALPESKSPRARRRLRLIRRKFQSLPEECAVLFEDETDLLLFPPLRAGWFLRGKPARVPISGENAKRVIFGTIDVDSGHRILLSREAACAVDFQVLLREIRKVYGTRKVALLLDKASRHTAETTTDLARKLDIEFIWLPRRATNINPMDLLWKWGKDKTCANKQHASIDWQADFFIKYLSTLSPEEALCKAGILSGRFWLLR
jgi:transposase